MTTDTPDSPLDCFVVWPDRTVQLLEGAEEPHSWMSDDYMVIHAVDEEAALAQFDGRERYAWQRSDPPEPRP